MENLKTRWAAADTAVKLGVVGASAIIGIIFVLKILPWLVAAMGLGALLAILILPYWAPTAIAFARKHPSRGAVLALNLFLGWTFIGWVGAFIWSLTDATARGPQSVVIHTNTAVSPSFNINAGIATPAEASYALAERASDSQTDPTV